MFDVLTITGPIFLLIGLGWAAVRFGVFEPAHTRVLGRFVLMLCLPALLFDALSKRRLDEILFGSYIAAYALGSLTAMGIGVVWARWRRGAPMSLAALQGMRMSCPNSGYVGFPLLQQVLGAPAAGLLALNMLVENLLLLLLSLALADAEGHGRARRALIEALKSLVRNPLVIAIALGLVVAALEWRLPVPLARTISLLSAASTPLALIVVGGTLVGMKLEGAYGDVARVAFGKLLLHPLATLGFVLVLPEMPPAMTVGVVISAAMPMIGIYPLLAQKHHHERFCAAALLAATVLSFFTISAGLWWLRQHPGWLPP